jgi:hypothetical protein
MTTNSTKYFCNRGALSARFILVDTPLRGEYYYDGEHGKYYFGARYFDPFFGMWMSPDPASVLFRETYTPLKCRSIIEKDILQRSNGEPVLLKQSFRASAQFSNPYTYGGDPINFIDPTGLFALDLAFVSIGWDSNKGWNFGFSTPFYSYTWNQNGSKTFTAGIDASTNLGFFVLGGDLGYSYNTYSGHSVSTGGHICLGAEGNCAGIEAGGSLYWDPYGNYLGATAYGGAFAELTLGDYNAKVNAGYEIGLMGMEGRGLYAGANVGKDGASLYASWAENGGWNYGGGYRFEAWRYDGEKLSLLSNLISFTPFLLAADVYDKENNITRNVGELIKEDGDGVVSVVIHGNQDGTVLWEGVNYTPEEFFEIVLKNEITNKTTLIDLYTCLGGYGGENSIAQKLANVSSVKVRAATGYVRPIIFNVLGMVIGSFDKDRLVGDSKIDGNVVVKDPKWMYFNAK